MAILDITRDKGISSNLSHIRLHVTTLHSILRPNSHQWVSLATSLDWVEERYIPGNMEGKKS